MNADCWKSVERIGGAHRCWVKISSLLNFCKGVFSRFALQLASAKWELNLEQAMAGKTSSHRCNETVLNSNITEFVHFTLLETQFSLDIEKFQLDLSL